MRCKIFLNNLIKIPNVKQTTEYSCGAACVKAIYLYFNINKKTENYFIKELNTNEFEGTNPYNIIKLFKKDSFWVKEKHNMTLDGLEKFINNRIPVMCLIQAWGKNYKKDLSGHYLIVTGIDEKLIYFMDPALSKSIGCMKKSNFLKRWHDSNYEKEYNKYGIAIWYNSIPKESSVGSLRKII